MRLPSASTIKTRRCKPMKRRPCSKKVRSCILSRRSTERKTQVDAAASKKGAKLAKAKPAAKIKPKKMPKKLNDISHAAAKELMPKDGFIRRNRTDGAWACRVPPHPQFQRSWAKHGEGQALELCITMAWRQHCRLQGIAESECPMQGLNLSCWMSDLGPKKASVEQRPNRLACL